MRVLALSASCALAICLASPREALADPPAPTDAIPAPSGATPSPYVPGPQPYVISPSDPADDAGQAGPSGALHTTSNAKKTIAHPFFVGLSAGVAWINPRILGLQPQSFLGSNLGLQAGYTINDRFSIGFEFTTAEKGVTRGGQFEPFGVPVTPQAGCDNCPPTPVGGWVSKTTLLFGQVAPRVEYTPFGEKGFFLGAAPGVAFIQLLTPRAGFGGSLRAGYRFRLVKIIDLGLEAGAQGQVYQDGHVFMVSGLAVFRPHI